MEEIKDTALSVLDLSVTSGGDEEMAARAVKCSACNCLMEPEGGNCPIESEIEIEPRILPASVTQRQYQKIEKAIRFVNDSYRTDIRRDAVAGLAGMSSSHFSRMFRKVMGVSYQEYLNSRRIAKAKRLLRTSPLSVTEIAAYLGFADTTGFGRIFKKMTGHTPSAYRSLPLR
jgi:AraC-like DNA-binding protein